MRTWARNTGRAALVAASAVAVGVAFGSGATATADITVPGGADGLGTSQVLRDIGQGGRHGGDGMQTAGNFSIGGGNQIVVPISIPVNVCGNSVAVLGVSRAKCKGGAGVSGHRSHGRHHSGHRSSTGGGREHGGHHGGHHDGRGGHGRSMKTSGNFSILGGNQVVAPISVPVNVCGNSVAVLGVSQAKCKGGASVERVADGGSRMKTSGNFSILGGNQVVAPISVPVNVCGNSVAVLGVSQAKCKGGASVGGGEKPHHHKPKHHKPKHKHHKPSKHRPAAKHKKLPSTLRGTETANG